MSALGDCYRKIMNFGVVTVAPFHRTSPGLSCRNLHVICITQIPTRKSMSVSLLVSHTAKLLFYADKINNVTCYSGEYLGLYKRVVFLSA